MSDRFVIAGLIVLVTDAQGKLRQVPLTLQQSRRVRRFVGKLHGDGIHIAPEDLILLTEKDALETFGKLTGKLPFLERWKSRFKKLTQRSQRSPSAELTDVVRPIGGPVLVARGSTESRPTTGLVEPNEPWPTARPSPPPNLRIVEGKVP